VLQPPSGGWYDTGDIVDVDGRGFVTILGRAKRFAKIGGEMVSLGAVEEFVHRRWPEAGHAAVALADPRKGERIVLVTTEQGLQRADLVQAAREAGIPELMVPAEVVHRPDLPLLGTGKVDYPSVQKMVAADLAAA
jgi:acyl-[acyl-carrier-protein]-phospholipid O-acyltransferase/long-chain-fatty-acid--[acyl-carrier-protein] ligase